MVAITVGIGVLVEVGSGVKVALGMAAWVSTAACVTSKTEVRISCSRLGVGGSSVEVGVCGLQAEIIPRKTSKVRAKRRCIDKL
jgi:hypothetical protein